jgi:hypothetical protein
MAAYNNDKTKELRVLLNEMDARSRSRSGGLSSAEAKRYAEAIIELIQDGARPDIKNKDGEIAIDLYRENIRQDGKTEARTKALVHDGKKENKDHLMGLDAYRGKGPNAIHNYRDSKEVKNFKALLDSPRSQGSDRFSDSASTVTQSSRDRANSISSVASKTSTSSRFSIESAQDRSSTDLQRTNSLRLNKDSESFKALKNKFSFETEPTPVQNRSTAKTGDMAPSQASGLLRHQPSNKKLDFGPVSADKQNHRSGFEQTNAQARSTAKVEDKTPSQASASLRNQPSYKKLDIDSVNSPATPGKGKGGGRDR